MTNQSNYVALVKVAECNLQGEKLKRALEEDSLLTAASVVRAMQTFLAEIQEEIVKKLVKSY